MRFSILFSWIALLIACLCYWFDKPWWFALALAAYFMLSAIFEEIRLLRNDT